MSPRPTPAAAPRLHWIAVAPPHLIGALLALALAAASLASLWLTRVESGVAAVWLANGLLVAVLLSRPRRDWPALLAWGFPALLLPRLWIEDSIALDLTLSLINLGEAVLVAALVRARVPDVFRTQHLVRASLWGAGSSLLACALSGLLATLAFRLIEGVALAPAGIWLTWFSAHLLGLVICTLVALLGLRLGVRLLGRRGRRIDLLTCLGLLTASFAGIFLQHAYPLLFLPLLPLVLLAWRHELEGAVLGLCMLAVAAALGAANAWGPFGLTAAHTHMERAILLQIYVLAGCLLALPVAVLVTDRRRLVRRMHRSEASYRLLAEHTRDLVVRLGQDGRRRYVSNSSFALLGYHPEELLAPRWELVHPEDTASLRDTLEALFRDGGEATARFRVRHREGHWVWIEALAQRVTAEDGDGFEVVYSGRDISRRVAAEAALEAAARTDALSGLPNRRAFEERLEVAVARSRRFAIPLALLAMDLDRFKQINDTLGHAAGDQALQAFAERIRAQLYEVDLAARLGGDEFVVLLEDVPDEDACLQVARKLLTAMETPMLLAGERRQVATSIGIAWCEYPESSEAVMQAADEALYAAKHAGRGTARLHRPRPACPPSP